MKIFHLPKARGLYGIRSSVVHFAQSVEEIATQLPLDAENAGIIFVHQKLENFDSNRKLLVRPGALRAARSWLVLNNSLYAHIQTSQSGLDVTNVSVEQAETTSNLGENMLDVFGFQTIFADVKMLRGVLHPFGAPFCSSSLCLTTAQLVKDCGGVLPISALHSTTIQYKFEAGYGRYRPTEFCVWTLLPQGNVQSVRLQVNQTMASARDGIVVYFWNSTGLTGLKLPCNNTDITFDTPVSLLTFSSDLSDNLVSRGFSIVITATGGQGPTVGRAYHIEKHEGEFSYPVKTGLTQQYREDDRVSIIVKRKPEESVWQRKEMKLRNVDLESESDFIAVYMLTGYWDATTHVLLGNVTGTADVDFSMHSIYPALFLFTSGCKTTGTGFTIQWNDFPHKVDL